MNCDYVIIFIELVLWCGKNGVLLCGARTLPCFY